MPTPTQDWLAGEIAAGLASALEGLTGHRAAASSRPSVDPPAEPALRWRQPFTGVPGAIWICASASDSSAVGAAIFRAAEVEESDPAKLTAETLELVRQALSAAARAMSAKLGREIVAEPAAESSAPAAAAWFEVEIRAEGLSATAFIGIEPALEAALEPKPESEPLQARNYDLLLDVELPVSISFGRAHVPLKDVLKLTTGSIVELNRDLGDPVEVIVNNCVIARGEVVVIEGNFGVRIQHVISRQERLRTLE